jgi:hypothetical protein
MIADRPQRSAIYTRPLEHSINGTRSRLSHEAMHYNPSSLLEGMKLVLEC